MLHKITSSLLVIVTLTLSIGNVVAADNKLKVAVLVSGYGSQGNENLSYDLEELAQMYLILHDNEVEIDIVSPKGGALLVKNNKDDLAYIQRFKHKTRALTQLSDSLSAKQAMGKDYDAVAVIGGSGAMFDLPFDRDIQAFLTAFADDDKPIAAVCHGPASLVNIKTKDGNYFVAGKTLNSFTNAEEKAFGSDIINDIPFLLEDELKRLGANFVNGAPMLPYIAIDGNLITAQNPGAVAGAAETLLLTLGKTPKERMMFKDEASLQLVAKARATGAIAIRHALISKPEQYDMQYLGLYGFYAYKLAKSDSHKLKELAIMAEIGSFFSHPVFEASLIERLNERQQISKAKARLVQALKTFPDNKQLQTLANNLLP